MKCSFSQRTGSFPWKQRRFDNPFSNQVKIPFTYFGCQDYSSKINPDGINFLEIAEFDKNGSARSSFMPMTLKIRKSTWQPARSVRALSKPKQNIFAYTSLFVLFSAVCTIFLFVFKNAYLLNFSSLLKTFVPTEEFWASGWVQPWQGLLSIVVTAVVDSGDCCCR